MAQPIQNINYSAFRSMFEREKLSGTNFNDWLRQLKLVLRVEKKMFVIEQPIPHAPAADPESNVLAEWNAIYDAYNEVACLMLGSMTPKIHRQFENYSSYDMLQELKSMFEKQAGVKRFDLIQTFHACKQEESKPVGAYVLKMKDYVEQLEPLGFVRNYNMHNMGKIIGELHAMLIEYEKGLPKKAETPQVMMIKIGGSFEEEWSYLSCRVVEEKEASWHCQFIREAKKLKQGAFYFAKRAKHNLDTYLWHCRLAHINKKRIEKLQQEGLLKSTDDESFDQCVSCLSGKRTRKSFSHRFEWVTDLLGIIHTDVFETFKVFKNEVENQLGRTHGFNRESESPSNTLGMIAETIRGVQKKEAATATEQIIDADTAMRSPRILNSAENCLSDSASQEVTL
nr:hypothetical protein [Tanacetum cinerariifolium]